MNNDIRWKQRFQNFENAYNTFNRMINRYDVSPDDEAIQMALVQAFEFTFELAWNTMKDYLENEGYDEVKNSKQTIRTAFRAELIYDAEKWMDVIQKRNLAGHTYNQSILEETVKYIKEEFYPLVRKLYEDLKNRL
ncbi:MAG: nucleotidyltransferase substrate binding protein [Nitrospirota bacterium]